jgi:hypothetical protein
MMLLSRRSAAVVALVATVACSGGGGGAPDHEDAVDAAAPHPKTAADAGTPTRTDANTNTSTNTNTNTNTTTTPTTNPNTNTNTTVQPQPSAPPAATSTPPPATSTAPAATSTAPAAPSPPAKVRLAVIGDFGADIPDQAKVAALVKSWAPDHVLTLGDDNYPSGSAATIDANVGKQYHQFIGNYRGTYGAGSTSNRFWPTPGNHDWVAPGLTPYTDYFTLPGNERYYDVDLGLVHLYALDSDGREPDGTTPTSKQGTWLKERMAASRSCFDLVYFHHAPFSSGDHGSDSGMKWPFETWGAEAVMSGHDHDYERLQVGGIPYFVNGLGGAGIYPFEKPALPETKLRYDEKHGAMLITATSTGITYEFWSHDGQLVDRHSVAKACN